MNVVALVYGVIAMLMLAWPGSSGVFFTDWIVLIGLVLVLVTGGLYMAIARPGRNLNVPEGDAIELPRCFGPEHPSGKWVP